MQAFAIFVQFSSPVQHTFCLFPWAKISSDASVMLTRDSKYLLGPFIGFILFISYKQDCFLLVILFLELQVEGGMMPFVFY